MLFLDETRERLRLAGLHFAQYGLDLSYLTFYGNAAFHAQQTPRHMEVKPSDRPNDVDGFVHNPEVFGALASRVGTEHHSLNGYEGDTVRIFVPGAGEVELTKQIPAAFRDNFEKGGIDVGVGARVLRAEDVFRCWKLWRRPHKDDSRIERIDERDFDLAL